MTDDSVWVSSSKPDSVERIDPANNKIVAEVSLPGEACSGLAFGFASLWVPLCGKEPSLVRVSVLTNEMRATLPSRPAGPEGGITASPDNIWIVRDQNGTLSRVDPVTGKIWQKISIPSASYVMPSAG
ncbi:MAG: hypothetical protein ABSB82_16275 [Terriglobia bacterium]